MKTVAEAKALLAQRAATEKAERERLHAMSVRYANSLAPDCDIDEVPRDAARARLEGRTVRSSDSHDGDGRGVLVDLGCNRCGSALVDLDPELEDLAHIGAAGQYAVTCPGCGWADYAPVEYRRPWSPPPAVSAQEILFAKEAELVWRATASRGRMKIQDDEDLMDWCEGVFSLFHDDMGMPWVDWLVVRNEELGEDRYIAVVEHGNEAASQWFGRNFIHRTPLKIEINGHERVARRHFEDGFGMVYAMRVHSRAEYLDLFATKDA